MDFWIYSWALLALILDELTMIDRSDKKSTGSILENTLNNLTVTIDFSAEFMHI